MTAHSHMLPDKQIASCGDVSCELLVDPIPRPAPPAFEVRLKPRVPEVILVDNRKPNSLRILQMTQEILRERGVAVRDEIPRKPSAGVAMDEEMLEKLTASGGLILAGISD